jgi:GntR family transcriptional regulator, rspAB operon transcriptional repressor
VDPNRIYAILKKKITWLELSPGSILNLSELAQDFGVSRTPVKEALMLLQADEWVLRNGTHFLVTPLSLDRIKDITEIRSVMERQANLWAMERITEKELTELKKITNRIKKVNDKTSLAKLLEIDFSFHSIIFKATQNQQLIRIMEGLLAHYSRFWLSFQVVVDRKTCFDETLDIIEAIETKDASKLEKATTEHINRSLQAITGSFKV